MHLSTGSFPKCLPCLRLGEEGPGTPVWFSSGRGQGPMCLSHDPLPPRMCTSRKLEEPAKRRTQATVAPTLRGPLEFRSSLGGSGSLPRPVSGIQRPAEALGLLHAQSLRPPTGHVLDSSDKALGIGAGTCCAANFGFCCMLPPGLKGTPRGLPPPISWVPGRCGRQGANPRQPAPSLVCPARLRLAPLKRVPASMPSIPIWLGAPPCEPEPPGSN